MESSLNKGVYVIKLNNGKYYVGKSNYIRSRIKQHKSDDCAKFVKMNGGLKKRIATLTTYDANFSNWEKNETIARMIKHGFNNVRGWEYTDCKDLTKFDYYAIRKEILGLTDRCRKCGRQGHLASDCNEKEPKSWLKELNSHIEEDTNKKSTKSNKQIFDSLLNSQQSTSKEKSKSYNKFECEYCGRVCKSAAGLEKHLEEYCEEVERIDFREGVFCYNCGEEGHYANECCESTEEDCYECNDHGYCKRCGRSGHYTNECYAKTHARGFCIR